MSGISLPKSYFVSIFCEALLHGTYTVLTGGTLYLLLRKPREQRLQRTNLAVITLTLLMYLLGTVHVALALRVDLIAFFDQHAIEGCVTIFDDQGDLLVWLQIMIELLNCLIGDAIVAWRTWVLWERDNRVLIFPVLCGAGCVISGTGMVVALSKSSPGQDIFSGTVVAWFIGFGALGCVANIYAVILMSWKAWEHVRFMKKMKHPAMKSHYSSAMLLIIESGLIYCLAAIITSILFVMDNNGVYIIADMLIDLTGIYPTIIIVLVCLKLTYADEITRAETLARQTLDSAPDSDSAKCREVTTLSWRVTGTPGTSTTTMGTATTMSAGELDTASHRDSDTAATRLYEIKPFGLDTV